MNKINILTTIATGAIIAFASCKKPDAKLTISDNPTAPILSINPTKVILDSNKADSDEIIATLNWSKADYGIPMATTYTLQLAKQESDLGKTNDSAKVIALSTFNKDEYKTSKLNNLAFAFGGVEFTDTKMFARILSSNPDNVTVPVLKSNVLQFIVVPFKKAVAEAAKVYVPGDYQGWNPATAPVLESPASDGIYSGIIDINKVNNAPDAGMFKINSKPDWSGPNYGKGAAAGTLDADGGAANLQLPLGTYNITANLNNLTYTTELVNWGLIGNATNLADLNGNNTPDGWETDQNMTYDYATKTYQITFDLFDGFIKFRKNDDWGVNFGDNGNDLSLEAGGADIPVTAGNYTIKLDVVNKTYEIKKN